MQKASFLTTRLNYFLSSKKISRKLVGLHSLGRTATLYRHESIGCNCYFIAMQICHKTAFSAYQISKLNERHTDIEMDHTIGFVEDHQQTLCELLYEKKMLFAYAKNKGADKL